MPKIQPRHVQAEVDEGFRDETANFNLSAALYPRTDPNAPRKDLAYVNLTGSGGPTPDAGSRKLVRAHVMREFQRQKKLREQQDLAQVRRQSQQNPKIPLPSIHHGIPSALTERNSWNAFETIDRQTEIVHGNSDWTANFPTREYQIRPVGYDIFGQQTEEDWGPHTKQASEEARYAENMIYHNSVANPGLDLPLGVIYGPNYSPPSLLALQHEPPLEAMMPEQLECPIISQSIITLSSLSSDRVDPFDAMPGIRNARVQALMYHCELVWCDLTSLLSCFVLQLKYFLEMLDNKVLINTLIPLNPKEKWFNYAISDPALFHATMLHSASHNAILSGNNNLADPTQLKRAAMNLVNGRLGDPVLSISDVTIGAVACLTIFENQQGNVELSNIHMNGLRRMVKIRGGLQTLGLAGILSRKILWADLCNATISLSKPRFNLRQDVTTKPNQLSNSSSTPTLRFTDPASVSECDESCRCDNPLTDILISLRSLSQTLSTSFPTTVVFTDEIYSLERRLVILLEPGTLENHPSPCSSLTLASSLAVLIYIYIFCRDFSVRVPILAIFVERLVKSLFKVKIEHVWSEEKYPMLLWVLVMGALVAEERVEREPLVRELRKVCDVLGVMKYEDFVASLRKIVWMESKNYSLCRVLWSEIKLEMTGYGAQTPVSELMAA